MPDITAPAYAPFASPLRRCKPTELFIIQRYSWQSFGDYTSGEREGSWFAAPVRASNEYMARDAVLRQVFPCGPVIISLKPIEPMPRPEKDRARYRRENPPRKCYCPDDCNCHHSWRPNYCGCRAHKVAA